MFGSLLQPMWNSCWAHRWRSINICWMNERTTFGAFAPVYQCCLSSSKNSLRPTTFYSSNTKPHPNTLCTVRPSPAEGSTPTPMQSVGSYAKHVPNTSCILPENFKVSVSAPRKGSRCHVGPILWTPPPRYILNKHVEMLALNGQPGDTSQRKNQHEVLTWIERIKNRARSAEIVVLPLPKAGTWVGCPRAGMFEQRQHKLLVGRLWGWNEPAKSFWAGFLYSHSQTFNRSGWMRGWRTKLSFFFFFIVGRGVF